MNFLVAKKIKLKAIEELDKKISEEENQEIAEIEIQPVEIKRTKVFLKTKKKTSKKNLQKNQIQPNKKICHYGISFFNSFFS